MMMMYSVGRRGLARNFFISVFVLGLATQFALIKPAAANVSLMGVFNDNCVLQRDVPLPIFGFADPQEPVTVELNGDKESTQAGADGRWKVMMKPLSAGGPYTLNVTGKNTLQVKNVLIGEVWMTVGQSNMMMQVASADGGAEAVADPSKFPLLRIAYEHANRSPAPADKVSTVGWGPPNGGNSATGFFFGQALYNYFQGKVPVGILTYTEIDPAESWLDVDVMKSDPKLASEAGGPFTSQLFNTTVKPIAPFAIRGVLYYQGEMNAGWAPSAHFCAVMTDVIKSWRKAFQNETMPFLFVQLPGFQDQKAAPDPKMDMPAASLAQIQRQGPVNGYCEIREAQLMTLKSVPNTGMAVTIDVGEQWNIHPHNKKTVGERLFLQARHVAYHDDSVVYSGPLIKNVEFKGSQVIATFDQIGSKLVSHGDRLAGFELAGNDQKTYPAEAKIEGDKVIITCSDVKVPVGVYYAWAGFPFATLFNAEGLPASPFRAYDYGKMQVTGDHAEITLGGPNFDPEAAWSYQGGTELQKKPDGNVVSLPKDNSQLFTGVAGLTGFNFNCNAAASPYYLRPGNIMGYSMELAAGPGTGLAECYYRFFSGGSYWDRPQTTTASEKFVPRYVAQYVPTNTDPQANGTFMFANLKRDGIPVPRPILVRNMSNVKILRGMLGVNSTDPIDLGHVAANATAESKPIVVTNTQKGTLPEQTTDAPVTQSPTVIYGLADVKRDETGTSQVVRNIGDNVGAILLGANASNFEFTSPNATADKMGVRFLGEDKGSGLVGGATPETESFTVHFKGAPQPGTYEAKVRIVTQAANLGILSQGNPDEPPYDLYYIDIPIKVTVP